MSTLRAILEVQGALDTAVINSPDPRVAEIANEFLPDTSTNAGWYREIATFLFGDQARSEANPILALSELFDAETNIPQAPSVPELSRLLYGVGAIIRLKSEVPTAPLPDFARGEEVDRELLTSVLALGGPYESFEENRTRVAQYYDEVVGLFANEFYGWQAWYGVATSLEERFQILKKGVASVPLCQAVVVKVNGIDSVVIDAKISSDEVTLNNLKKVVDPRNWHYDYPDFFCSMEYRGPRTDGWRKVLERVGICNFSPLILRTMLKFYKSTVNGPDRYEARLDYDLNDPVPDPAGDGQITVDRGFINMWTPPGKGPNDYGVVVRIRKVAHINGLSPYAMKKFVCIMGYAYVAMEMLFGPAKAPDPNIPWALWEDDPNELPGQGQQSNALPAQSTNTVASTAIKMVAECVQDITAKQADLAGKWTSGDLTVADLAQCSAEVGARIASDPWKFIQAIGKTKGGGT